MTAEPFKLEIPDSRLEDLQRRLRAMNWPADLENDDWSYGTNAR